ncbi:Ribosomal RNA processing Brix domain protein isoform 1 [Hibiscus syriacus]|uniref:Ribosomal RNA processing Brix domain protein isoform 1 n=1 Tax=Hibiscus syriacus TaxID=106335 RepID=A0A6A2X7I8_HIBSY|nr:Ribosomal RNA processing Brix domain protein isoform 1 [Hibiscus syriacus]
MNYASKLNISSLVALFAGDELLSTMEDCYCNGSHQLRSGRNECAYQKDSRRWREPYNHLDVPSGYFRCFLGSDHPTFGRGNRAGVLLNYVYVSWFHWLPCIKTRPKLTADILFQLFLNALIGLEKVNLRNKAGVTKVIGTLVCIGGTMVLTLYKGKTLVGSDTGVVVHTKNYANMMVSSKNKKERWAIGSIFLAAGTVFLSSWFLLQARIGRTYPCQYSSTAILSFFSGIQSAIISLITERDFTRWMLKEKLELITMAYSGMVGSGMCYVGLSWCVKQKGPVFTSAFTPLVQRFVAIFDFTILHGQIYFGRNREAEQIQQLKQTHIEEDSNARAQV